jgi:acetylornithine deacetylase/succinyl-diaminopimelate desuccinylase-like protein
LSKSEKSMSIRDHVVSHLLAIGAIGFPGETAKWTSLDPSLFYELDSSSKYSNVLRSIPGCLGEDERLRGWTRLAFTEEEDRVHGYAVSTLEGMGFDISIDSFGNVFGRKGNRNEPAIMIGTHLDTVIDGGNYDGVVGFIVAVESVRRAESNGGLRHPVEIAIFRAEESTRFKMACLGSQAAFGFFSNQMIESLKDGQSRGLSLSDVLKVRGCDLKNIVQDCKNAKDYIAYFETHIEQAKKLERTNAVGLVTSIRAPKRRSVTVTGKRRVKAVAAMILAVEFISKHYCYAGEDVVGTVGEVHGYFAGADKINAVCGYCVSHFAETLTQSDLDNARKISSRRGCVTEDVDAAFGSRLETRGQTAHSGGTEMGLRQDALAAHSEIVLSLDDSYIKEPLSEIKFFMDLRSNSSKALYSVNSRIDREFKDIASDFQVECEVGNPIGDIDPVPNLDKKLRSFVKLVAEELKIQTEEIPSGAGHDAMYAHKVGIPTAMIFVKSIEGLSHTPEEFTPTEDIVRSIELQAAVLQHPGFPIGL